MGVCVDTEEYLCAIYKYIFTHVQVYVIIVSSEGFVGSDELKLCERHRSQFGIVE